MLLSMLLVSILLLDGKLCQCSEVDRILFFEPNTEYVFQLKTNADMKSTQIDSTVKVSASLLLTKLVPRDLLRVLDEI